MLDEEVQYLGTRPAPYDISPTRTTPFHHLDQPQVTGIVLHIKDNAYEHASKLEFLKSKTTSILVGRRSSSEDEPRKDDNSTNAKALFRCPVISRRHSRIAFSEGGHVFIVDLNSHHGTHILKPFEMASRMLEPDNATMLANGDTVTFGKTVGKGDELVRPVTARVELLYGNPVAVASTHADHMERVVDSSSTNLISGRYGLSDGSSESSSDRDSDIEEITSPNAQQSVEESRCSSQRALPSFRALDILKWLVPPAHHPSAASRPTVSQSATSSSLPEAPGDGNESLHSRHTSPMELSSPSPAPEGSVAVTCRPWWNSSSNGDLDLSRPLPALEAGLPDLGDADRINMQIAGDLSLRENDVHDAYDVRDEEGEMREEESIRRDQCSLSQAQRNDAPVQASMRATLAPPSSGPLPAIHTHTAHFVHSPSQSADGPHYDTDYDFPPYSSLFTDGPSHEPAKDDVASLNAAVELIQQEISKLHGHRRKYKARFNSNVHTISERLEALEDQLADVQSEYTGLADQIEDAMHVDIPTLYEQITTLQERVDHPPERLLPQQDLMEQDDIKSDVAALRALVAEMKSLHEMTKTEMAAELEAVKLAGRDAVGQIKSEVEELKGVALKRKRSLPDDGDETFRQIGDVALAQALAPETVVVPSRKRARRIVSAVVQTTTAVTVGAVVAWSALAFS
ncbi:hypothetical protein PLICRDRAFT_38915 [Plicaturopsis crispa FD-325 SS-3]|nr:hypothetical protein PLICRDRAFT_38915 [Plicaturopsis crispa FD-325 SS-3]